MTAGSGAGSRGAILMRSLFKAQTGLESFSLVIDPLLILDISLFSLFKISGTFILKLPPGFLIDYLHALASHSLLYPSFGFFLLPNPLVGPNTHKCSKMMGAGAKGPWTK